MKVTHRISVLVGASALTWVASVNAAAPAAAVSGGAVELSEVIVTGSRVIQNGNDSPTPVTVISTDQLALLRPATIAESLNELPVFAGSVGALSTSGNRNQNAAVNANSGNSLNLRALGLTRTLVLYDGHRVPPTAPDAIVDVDMIPQMLLQRVDVVTGGASAIYGSDAIGGVVNFVTNRKFDGVKVNILGGMAQKHDDEMVDAGVAYGASLFGGRGHWEGSIQYRKDNGVDERFSRDWARKLITIQGAGNAATPYVFVSDTHVTNATFGGRINTGGGTLNGQQFTTGGFLIPFVAGNTAGIAPGVAIQSGGDGAYQTSVLKTPLEMKQLYGRFDFDVSDNLHFYASASAAENYVFVKGAYLSTQNNTTLSVRNAYLLPQYQAQFANPAATFTVGRFFNDVARTSADSRSKQYYLNAGLEGKFGAGYTWDISLTQGSAEQLNRNFSNRNLGRYSAALDAVAVTSANVGPSGLAIGSIACNVTLTNPGAFPGCVPLNIFGNNSANQTTVDYILGTTAVKPKTSMSDVAASLTGAPFHDWAGPVRLALSGEWRKLTYSAASTTSPTDLLNCAALGLRFNCNATTTLWSNPIPSRSEISQTVGEGALEASVPLLEDLPFAKSLDLDAAARYTHYDTSGNATTWKSGVTWNVIDQLTVRASRSRDIRAPNLDELYRVSTIATNGTLFPDRLTNANYTALGSVVLVQNGGNAELVPEKADTTTYGIVYRPTPNLSLAVDAFSITINDVIFNVQGNDPTAQDSCYASGGSSPYCLLQVRPLGFSNTTTANVVTKWIQSPLNFARMKTSGVDLEANWSTSIGTHGLTLRGLTTYQPHIYYFNPGAATLDLAGTSFSGSGYPPTPNWRATMLASLKVTDKVTVGITGKWRSSLGHTPDPTTVVAAPRVPSVAFANLNLSYKTKLGAGDADVFLNVQNLFNRQPPTAAFFGSANSPGSGSVGGFVAGDDPIGRYFTVGVRFGM